MKDGLSVISPSHRGIVRRVRVAAPSKRIPMIQTVRPVILCSGWCYDRSSEGGRLRHSRA